MSGTVRRAELVSVVSLSASLACGTGTDLNQIVNVNPESDASAGGSESGTTALPNPFAGAPGYAAQTGEDSHNAGVSCLDSGCHGPGGNGPSFLIGGTVYADYAGTSPAVGVEVRIVDFAGHAASAYSGSNGNFFIRSGGAGVALPATVGARTATTTRPMITTLSSAGMGSCGQTRCHVTGGGPRSGTGNYYPIHVP